MSLWAKYKPFYLTCCSEVCGDVRTADPPEADRAFTADYTPEDDRNLL